MKKIMFFAASILFAMATKVNAQMPMSIKNLTSCTANIAIEAHDIGGVGCNGSACGTYTAGSIVPSGGVWNISSQFAINNGLCGTGIGWGGGICYTNACASGGSDWDGVIISISGLSYLLHVGSGCGYSTSDNSGPILDCAGNTVFADWSVGGMPATIFVKIHY